MSWNMIFVQQIFVFCYFGSRGTSWNSIEYSLRIAEMMTNIMWSTYWSPHQIWLSFIGANMGCGNVFLIFWRWREMACDGRGGSVFSFPAAEKIVPNFSWKPFSTFKVAGSEVMHGCFVWQMALHHRLVVLRLKIIIYRLRFGND